jgi:hypothetical protein
MLPRPGGRAALAQGADELTALAEAAAGLRDAVHAASDSARG